MMESIGKSLPPGQQLQESTGLPLRDRGLDNFRVIGMLLTGGSKGQPPPNSVISFSSEQASASAIDGFWRSLSEAGFRPCFRWWRLLEARRVYGRMRRAARRFRGMGGRTEGNALQLAIVIPVSQPVLQDSISLQDECFRNFDCDAPEVSPHITLKLGFAASTAEPFQQILDSLAETTTEFEVSLGAVDVFEEGIAFLDVVSNAPLEELRQRLLDTLKSNHGIEPLPIEISGYRFHVTLAAGLSRTELRRLLATYSTLPSLSGFTASCLQLLSYTPTGWITIHEIGLKPLNPADA